MHFVIGFVAVAALIAFAFGRRALQVFVAIGLGVPALFVVFIIVGEVTRGGPDDVLFGKLGHRVTVEQPAAVDPQAAAQQAAEARRAAEAQHAAEAQQQLRAKMEQEQQEQERQEQERQEQELQEAVARRDANPYRAGGYPPQPLR